MKLTKEVLKRAFGFVVKLVNALATVFGVSET